jgi:hypothetical protein
LIVVDVKEKVNQKLIAVAASLMTLGRAHGEGLLVVVLDG